jgi:hypothetical protein
MAITALNPQILSLLPQAFTLNQPQEGVPNLVEAKLTFDTFDGGDDKDDNTKLKISLIADYGNGFVLKIADRGSETYGRFADGTTNELPPLNVNGTLPLSAIGNAKLRIEFEPDGDDTWKFHYTLDLKFENGLVLSKTGRDKQLTDKIRFIEE